MQVCERSLGYTSSSECEDSSCAEFKVLGLKIITTNRRLQYIQFSKVKYILQACIKYLSPRFREEGGAWLLLIVKENTVYFMYIHL